MRESEEMGMSELSTSSQWWIGDNFTSLDLLMLQIIS
jgi:hypothetical protein